MYNSFKDHAGVFQPNDTNTLSSTFTRLGVRELFALTVALVLGLNIAAGAVETAPRSDQLDWKMAVSARTFMRFTIFEAMDKTAALGLKYMSLSANVNLGGAKPVSVVDLSAEQIQTIKDHAKAKGITFDNAYVQFPADEAKCRQSFEFARKMGIDLVVGEPDGAALDTVAKLAKEFNIRVAIHDHPKPSRYWNPQTVLDAIKGRGPLMGACADTGHWIRSGLDPVECLKTLQGHVFCLHFKDLNEKSHTAHDVPWGTGIGQAKAMMSELKRQGFHGAYCAEYEYHFENSTPEIAECAKFFNQTSVELASQPSKP